MDYIKHGDRRLLHTLIAPFIWGLLPFAMLLDFVATIHQFICFPVYGLKRLKRSDYILILDRNKLAYLDLSQKIGCMYCGYMNGLFAYLKEIGALNEKYWCGIMHENKPGFKKEEHQIRQKFAAFNDEQDFNKKYLGKKS